jgi:energy-coupling factor transporter ATP-binding protein EcfA2
MYDFRTLSPLDFEELVRDLLQAEFGLRLESFGPGRDLGIDFRFAAGGGNAIVQAKHYPDSHTDALVRAASRENAKVEKLKPARYIFATSASLSPPLKAKLQKALPSAPLAVDDILGREDLNNLLGRHQEIEKKHFKLWLASTAVLERILHSGVYNRTQAEMDVIRAVVPKFVYNESVPQAEAILKKSGALIISGEPGVGKSTLARMLVWLHAEQNWRISVIDDIKEAFEIANEGEKRLVFFDDFLGQVRLSTDLIRGVDQRFPPFFQRVRTNKDLRFILTTRDYVLHQAQAQSSRLSTAAVNASEFTLNVGHYTRASRAKMFFNHLYFSDISSEERNALIEDDFFLKVVDHRNFNPRLIDLLTTADYVSIAGTPIRKTVEAVMENPQELWEKPYRTHISDEGRALMLALFFNSIQTPITALERAFGRMTGAMGLTIPRADMPIKFRSALKELEGSVFAIRDRQVSFSNPGIRDFLQRVIVEDKFLPAVIGIVTEFYEVYQAWTFFCGQKPEPAAHDPSASAWGEAIGRLQRDGFDSALRRLKLVVTMYDCLQTENLIPFVTAAIRDLESSEIEGEESYRCGEALEQLTMTLLPFDVLEDAKRVLSAAVAEMLVEYGSALNLDEIQSVSKSLFEHGVDEDAASRASKEGLKKYIENLSESLDELGSVSELEDYEKNLRNTMEEFGVSDFRVSLRIESRRENLMEREERADHEGYGGARSTPQTQISDDQIRSMFRGLRGS